VPWKEVENGIVETLETLRMAPEILFVDNLQNKQTNQTSCNECKSNSKEWTTKAVTC